LAIDYSSCGASARGTLARTKPRRAAPRGARRNDGRGGLDDDRGPNRAPQRGSDPHSAALHQRVCDADDYSRAVGPWPLTCDGRQACRRDSLHADGHGAQSRPARRKQVGHAPSGRPSRGISCFGLPPAQAPGEWAEGRPRPALPNMSCLRARFWRAGCPNAANPDTEPSARPS